MRRLIPARPSGERGAVAVITAVFAVVMVAIAALVVDIGSLHDERRQLQNGADAAALGLAQLIAKECAAGPCSKALLDSTAQALANGNALDGHTTVEVVYPPDYANRQVTVKTRTLAANGDTILPYAFAQAFSSERGKTVSAKATATWAGLKRAKVLPLAISSCDFNTATTNGTVYDTATVVTFHGLGNQCTPTPGLDFPGGFGWVIDDTARDCNVTLSVNDTVVGDAGLPGTPNACKMATLLGQDLLIPIYDGLVRNRGRWEYHIKGFAEFHLTGYRFPTQPVVGNPCASNTTCIAGYFIRFVGIGESGGNVSFGRRPALIS